MILFSSCFELRMSGNSVAKQLLRWTPQSHRDG